jgi:amino acid transporter
VRLQIFAKASIVLAAILLLSTLSILLSFFLRTPFIDVEHGVVFTGLSWATLKSNLWPRFIPLGPGQAPETYESVFSVVFPACIGILAGTCPARRTTALGAADVASGASMSGDLKSPNRSIPRGTLLGVGVTFWLYAAIVVLLGATTSRGTLYHDFSVIQDVRAARAARLSGPVSRPCVVARSPSSRPS